MHSPDAIAQLVSTLLPRQYEPLNLVFDSCVAAEQEDSTLIGNDSGSEFRVDVNSGEIIAVGLDDPVRFVNASIQQLASSIAAHKDYCEWMFKTRSESEELSIISKFECELRSIDGSVFSHPENWWATIVEQSRDGQL